MKHNIAEQFKEYVPGDCWAYTIKCSCGETFGDYHPKWCEQQFLTHKKVMEE